MPSPLYQQFMPQQQNNIFGMMQQLRQNPAALLAQRGFNIPQNVNTSNPNDILQYLMNSGQVSQAQIDAATQRANSMGIR